MDAILLSKDEIHGSGRDLSGWPTSRSKRLSGAAGHTWCAVQSGQRRFLVEGLLGTHGVLSNPGGGGFSSRGW